MTGPTLHLLRALALCFASLFGAVPAIAQDAPRYIGSDQCAGCHQDAAAAWAGSDHAAAWTLPTDATVLGDFNDTVFTHGGYETRFFRRDGTHFIETEAADGTRTAFPVVGVAGVAPLQQYLLSPEPGRIQAYDIAWDVDAGQWYPVFSGPVPAPGNGFHWTGPYKSWEARCAECHATGYTRNYAPETQTYAPVMAEIGVGCEACHGPGSAHVAWVTNAGLDPVSEGLTPMGLTADLAATPWNEVQQCMTCHSRREALADGNPLPGISYHDAFSLALLRDGQYFPDGAILDEVYEGGSFLQSKMHANGVSCTNCHEPHSGDLLAEGNAVCVQCHSPAGNPDFPTLPLRVFDGPEHHFHAEGTEGAQCTSCHMTQRTYMGIDERHDHSFRIPRPDLAATGSPDACTGCHTDEDAAWAAATLEQWYPDSTHRGPHFATVIAAARDAPEGQADALLDLAEGSDPAIVRATALELLSPVARLDQADRIAVLIGNADPLVRAAAARALQMLPPDERLQRLAQALTDPARAVRVAAARTLLDSQPAAGSPEALALSAAMAEWQSGMMARVDFPETYLQMGGIGLTLRNWDMAVRSFSEAVSLDPQLEDGWIILIRVLAATGDVQNARAAFVEAYRNNPESAAIGALGPEIGMGVIPPRAPDQQ